MDTDEKIRLAEEYARQLAGVDRNELKKWIEYLKVHGNIEKAKKLADMLSMSPMLRERPRRSYSLISSLKLDSLTKISLHECIEVLGYTSRILEGMLSQPQGVLKRRMISEEKIREARLHGRKAKFRR